MVKKIRIENYKCIKRAEIKDMKNLNILAGKNSSGKTTILESIFLYLARYNPDSISRLLAWRNYNNNFLDLSMQYKHIFNTLDTSKKVLFEMFEETNSRRMTITYKDDGQMPIFVNSNLGNIDISKSSNNSMISSELLEIESEETGKRKTICKLKYDVNNSTLFNESNSFERMFGAFISSSNRGNIQEASATFGKSIISKSGFSKKIIDMIKVIEPQVEDVQISTHNGIPDLYVDLGYENYIPLELLGDGVNRFVYLITRIIDCKNGILLIDEIETGFHHSVLESILLSLIEIAIEFNCQIISTTHDYELIETITSNSFDKYKDNISYYRISREDSLHLVQHFEYDTLKKTIINEFEVR